MTQAAPAPAPGGALRPLTWLSLLLGLGLRLWGIGFAGSTPRGRPDEEVFAVRGMTWFSPQEPLAILRTGWPEGYFRLAELVERAQAAWLSLRHGGEVNLGCLYAVDPGALYLPLRVASALAGTAACWVAGRIAARLAPPEQAGAAALFGTLALSCNYLAARDAHFAVTDAPLLLLLSITLLLLVRALQDDPRFLLGAGAAAGLALGVKYAAAAVVVPCAATAIASLRCAPDAAARRRRGWLVLAAVGCALGGFLLASPGVARHPALWLEGMDSHRIRYDQGARLQLIDLEAPERRGASFHLLVTLPAACGWAGLLLALAGLWRARRARASGGVPVIAFAAATYAMIAPTSALFVRYASPLLAALAPALGLALAEAGPLLSARLQRRAGLLAAAALALAALLPPLSRAAAFDRLLAAGDTRDQAAAWLAARGATAVLRQGNFAEWVHGLALPLREACRAALPPPLWREVPALLPHARSPQTAGYAAEVAGGRSRWYEIAAEALEAFPPEAAQYAGAQWVVQTRAVLECGRPGRPLPGPLPDPACFAEAARFDPGATACGGVIDVYDSFFAPFDPVEGPELTGPLVRVLRRTCPLQPPVP